MGRALTQVEKTRLIVELKKITYPDGTKLTRSLVPFDIEGLAYSPSSETINEIVPKIDQEYHALVERCRENEVPAALDEFLETVSSFAVVSDGLKEVLASDLGKDLDSIEKALMETKWFRSTISYVKSEFRKAKKTDPIEYAESMRQMIGLFGLNKALSLLNKNGVRIKDSTARALRRIASETPKIKALIREGKLKLTIAFELPAIEEKEREKIAAQAASLESYDKQKKFLKKVKQN